MDKPSQANNLGLQKTTKPWAEALELISSMRFAIALLCMIAISSVIGTILKQNEPMPNYLNQFGPFWFEVFERIGLYSVYSAWWFLSAFFLLLVSTTLCVIRNAPKMLEDMRSWRENVREQSLRNFHHHAEWSSDKNVAQLTQEIVQQITALGYQVKVLARESAHGAAHLISAKRGTANKLGYIFAHTGMIVILLGATLDSDLAIHMQTWFMGKVPYKGGGGLISTIPAQHRLANGTPTYRGNISIPEGQMANTAIIQQTQGVYLQGLPFSIELNNFNVDFYSTGMPKLFESNVTIHDSETGRSFPANIRVNHPLVYKGIAIYQSSFDDGGSQLKVKVHPLSGTSTKSLDLQATVGGTSDLVSKNEQKETYRIEWTGFRAINVENMARNGQDLRAVNQNADLMTRLGESFDKHTGSAGKNANNKDLLNVGASFQFKLRDKNGQAREFSNYANAVKIDGMAMFLSGTRSSPNEEFRYLRIPADENNSLIEWMRLRAALLDPELRKLASERFSKLAVSDVRATEKRSQLALSAEKGLRIFAGELNQENLAGYTAVAAFMKNIPIEAQENAANVFMKILQGSMIELWQVARERDKLPALEMTQARQEFLEAALSALSDASIYGAPVYLELMESKEIKASVFQVARAPGQGVVYFGCLLLVLGVFAMFYVRERRLWVWVKTEGEAAHALMAMSSQRKTLDFENEFIALKTLFGISVA